MVIIKTKDEISFSNPGGFRIEIDAAKSGGVSDPRNSTMLRMFNLINIWERAGSGIPNIMLIWKQQNFVEPIITETLEPERTTLILSMKDKGTESDDKKVTAKSDGKKVTAKSDGKKVTAKSAVQKRAVIEYITREVSVTSQDVAELLKVGLSRAKTILRELVAEEIIVAEGADKNRRYSLKR